VSALACSSSDETHGLHEELEQAVERRRGALQESGLARVAVAHLQNEIGQDGNNDAERQHVEEEHHADAPRHRTQPGVAKHRPRSLSRVPWLGGQEPLCVAALFLYPGGPHFQH